MSSRGKQRVRFCVISVSVWVSAFLLFCFLRHAGMDEFESVVLIKESNGLERVLIYGGVGFFLGLLYALTDGLFERRFFARQSYGRLLLTKIVLYFLMMKVLFIGMVIYLKWSDWEWNMIIGAIRSTNYWVCLSYALIVGAVFTFVRQMSQKFGPGVLWNLVRGKYRTPREEERVFMFLDLQSSTTIADQLGHVRFSQLIQDCFIDMTDALRRSGAEVYQYVGDEIVVSWPSEKGFRDGVAVRCFFDIQSYLKERMGYYDSSYGVQPIFKAGMHVGWVTVAEVGVLKREISYHGDTLNTTARIEGCCNQFERNFLASGAFVEALEPTTEFHIEELSEELLRGKKEAVKIFGITLAAAIPG